MRTERINGKNAVVRKFHPARFILVRTAKEARTRSEVVGSRVKYHCPTRRGWADWSDQNVSVGEHFGIVVIEKPLSRDHRADFRPRIAARIVNLRRVRPASVFSPG